MLLPRDLKTLPKTKPAVEFQTVGDELRLIYRPRDDTAWVARRFDAGEPLIIKGTFRLTRNDCQFSA